MKGGIMKRSPLILLVLFLLVACLNLSCSSGGAVPGQAKDPSLYEFSGSDTPALVRLDKQSFKPEQFVSRSLPVEVTFTGAEAADVLLKGALAYPDFNKSGHPTDILEAILVLEKTSMPLFGQMNDNVALQSLRMNVHMDLLDANGATVVSYDNNTGTLFPGYPQYFRYYNPDVPPGVASTRITIGLEKQEVIPPYTTPESLSFQIPQPLFEQTPVQFAMQMDNWNEEYKQDAALAEFNLKFKNPYPGDIDYQPMLVFLDDTNQIVGYMELAAFLPASGVMERPEDPWQSSYLSAIPTQVQVIDKFPIGDLYKAMH
jgi:hypothetical protein